MSCFRKLKGEEEVGAALMRCSRKPRIATSGFSETERVKKARRLGAGAYIKKPYVMEKIGVAIRDELDRR